MSRKKVKPSVPETRLIKMLGVKVRAIRRERRMTQSDLAKSAGITYKYVGEIERSEKNPSIGVMFRVSIALGLPLTDLLDMTDMIGETTGERIISSIGRILRPKKIEEKKRAQRVVRAMFKKE
jgi:transcriptional regulator with XRE-family HTH domain